MCLVCVCVIKNPKYIYITGKTIRKNILPLSKKTEEEGMILYHSYTLCNRLIS
jgi:hypothetical protein